MTHSDISLFKTIFEQTPISTQIFTPDGETYMVNKAWEKLWNIKFSVVKSYNILKDKQHEETGIMPLIKRAFRGEVVRLPLHKYVPSKTVKVKGVTAYRWLEANMYPIKNSNGQITHIVIQHEDVTQKREGEEGLYKLAAIVESSDDVIISKTLDGNITSWNKSAAELFGYSVEEAIGKHITLIIPPELRKEEDVIISSIKSGRRVNHFETVRITKDKKLVNLSITVSPIRDNKGNIIGASKIARDITEQIRTKNQLQYQSNIIENITDAVIGTDLSYKIITWNKGAEKMYGWKSKEVLGKQGKTILRTEFLTPEQQSDWKIALVNVGHWHGEVIQLRKDGTKINISTSLAMIKDDKGVSIGAVGINRDITEQKRIEQHKDDFLSVVSHELKTPLTSVKAFTQLLERKLFNLKDSKTSYYIQRMDGQLDKLITLVNDLLDVSKIQAGKLQFNEEIFNFDKLVADTIDEVQATTKKHTIIQKCNADKKISADKYRLSQVITNLLTNAIKYSPNADKIIVSTSSDDDEVTLEVQDFGVGIPDNQKKQLFERFYRADSTAKKFSGLGLGLYISYQIVTRHGGQFNVRSKEGEGSVFSFTIPFDQK